jgi:DNA excision repair protein ERCC-3
MGRMTTEDTQAMSVELQIARLQSLINHIQSAFPALKDLTKGSAELQEQVVNEITGYAMSIKTSKLDKDQLAGFFKHPYHLYKERRDKENEFHLAIPKFIDVQLGWLEKVTDSHNVFLINRYVDWLGELPDALKKKVGMKDPLDVFLDGDLLVGKDIEKVKEKYKPFIKGKDREGRLVIDKTKHFELLATLIRDGILPFVPRPIPKDLFVSGRKCDFELRDYQKEGWQTLLQYSNVGAFLPPSTGKTFFGMWVATHIKPPHLIAVPSNLLVQQWTDRIELYTDLKLKDEVDIMTYQMAIKHGHKRKYNGLIIDEVHHLPANEFSRLAVIPRQITVGLSATPQREDGREEYILP